MTRLPQHDILFEPLQIGPKVLKNRFFQPAHCSGFGSEKPGMQAALRGVKAEGGWAAVSTEYCSVSPESDDFSRIGARLWDLGDMRNLAATVEAIHEYDALAVVELVHASVEAPGFETRIPARSVQQVQSMYEFHRVPHAVSSDEIRELQQHHVDAAKRARAIGFDIITIHMAIAQGYNSAFFIPLFNQRTDEYGGTFEKRARFAREVLEMVREAVSDDCALALRYTPDTLGFPSGGVTATEDGYRFMELVDHLVDLWDIQLGWAGEWGEDAAPSRTHPENHKAEYLADVKKHTAKPVMNVGRFNDPNTMASIIRGGQCDVIGAVRPSIADPFLPKKIEEGRYDEIRECIGCNACVARWLQRGPGILCTQNATMGEEFRRGWHPERFSASKKADKPTMIVGAGPAGMEAAIVLGKRGTEAVHLIDAAGEVGGHMRWVPRLPGLAEWGRVVDYRMIQIDKLANVEFIPSVEMSFEDVVNYSAEVVILATGSTWAGDGLNGQTQRPIEGADAQADHVLTPEQVIGGKPLGERVLVFDTDGYYMAASLAELIARQGHDVTYVTPFAVMAPYTEYTLEAPKLQRTLRDLGVVIRTETMLTRVDEAEAVIKSLWEPEAVPIGIDSVVLATQRVSNTALHSQLMERWGEAKEAGISELHLVGDAYAPQMLADTIFHAHRLAREIDTANPSIPLPFIRERRVLGATDSDYTLDSELIVPPVL